MPNTLFLQYCNWENNNNFVHSYVVHYKKYDKQCKWAYFGFPVALQHIVNILLRISINTLIKD